MPLPRFERLPVDTKAHIVRVAATEFAAHGRDAASLATIADRAQLSRSAFYNYFDGKDDVFDTVRLAIIERLASALGPWQTVAGAEKWWAEFERAHDRLVLALSNEPTDAAFLRIIAPPAELEEWFREAFANAVSLELVDLSPGRELVESVTLASISAADALELENPGLVPFCVVREVLERVWARRSPA